jgi:large subunit ribosomal protein L13e
MAIRGNQQLVKTHLRKDWQRRVRCHFDQPGKKKARRVARQTKAAALYPRPVDKLRPIVQCPTIRYNRKAREGRGFSIAELKAAGVAPKYARTVGISVDGRRQNLSEEGLARNVERLKAYLARLVVVTNRVKKADKPDLSKIESTQTISTAFAAPSVREGFSEIAKSEIPAPIEGGAYRKLRIARSDARLVGARDRRAKEKAEAEAAKK